VLDGNQLDDFANTARIRLRIKRGGAAAGPLTDSSTMVAAFSLRIFPRIAQILAEFTKRGPVRSSSNLPPDGLRRNLDGR
jgi:hypothetical protein